MPEEMTKMETIRFDIPVFEFTNAFLLLLFFITVKNMILPKKMKGKPIEEWVDEYALAHQNRFNQICHTIGIPIIVIGLVLMPLGFATILPRETMWVGLGLFLIGWVLQFVGHAVEGKPPEFLRDWRFLFVGLRWWVKKMRGKV